MHDIVFIQPGYAHYRDPLYRILSKRYDLLVVYENSRPTYPGERRPTDTVCLFLDKAFLFRWFGLIGLLAGSRYGVIITSGSTTARTIVSHICSKIFGKKIILWLEEWREPPYAGLRPRNLLGKVGNIIGRWIIVRSDAIVASGTKAREYALTRGKRPGDVFMAMQCAEDQRAKGGDAPAPHRERSGKFVFLYLSRIIPVKGLDILIKAFASLYRERDDVSLVIAGDGPFRESCEQLAATSGPGGISFMGRIDPASAWQVYREADIFVLPSYFRENAYEGWGLVLNEAMSMGLPVITTDAVGASCDLVLHGHNGLIVEQGNAGALCRAMDAITGMDLDRMGDNSRKLFDLRNDYESMAGGFHEAIAHVKGSEC